MSVPRGGAGKQRADRLDRLPVPPDDAADITLPHRHAKHRRVSARALRDDHFVRELNQIAEDELEELFHAVSVAGVYSLSSLRPSTRRAG